MRISIAVLAALVSLPLLGAPSSAAPPAVLDPCYLYDSGIYDPIITDSDADGYRDCEDRFPMDPSRH